MSDLAPLVPSSFLPHLARSQTSFAPHLPADILVHISVLKELYVPPVHGGFDVSDYDDRDDDDENDRPGPSFARSKVENRERRFSAGLVETMDGLGLGLDIPEASGTSQLNGRSEDDDEAYSSDEELDEDEDEDDDEPKPHLDPFERDWSEKWLSGVVRRAQGCIEEHESTGNEGGSEVNASLKEAEAILRDASAVLAMMAGTSAAGSLTRHLLFPMTSSLEPGLKALRPTLLSNPTLSPTTHTFLSSLATSPTSPLTLRRRLSRSRTSDHSSSPSTSFVGSLSSQPSNDDRPSPSSRRRGKRRRPAVPVLLHDAPMSDHLSVGVQTWGSAILLGRRMARHPDEFGLFTQKREGGIRILELGAGTGLLSILCRKLLDLHAASTKAEDGEMTVPSSPGRRQRLIAPKVDGLVVATDFLPEVLANLKTCVDLNFPTPIASSAVTPDEVSGIHIAKLDWTTFPSFMQRHRRSTNGVNISTSSGEDEEEMHRFVDQPFDLVLASDCVYDPTHAALLRQVASDVLRLPDPSTGDQGGTFHILSPIRPTFTPELESIDANFPPHPHPAPSEGLGMPMGLKLGTRGGKRSIKGRKGEGRVDEGAGYWWWEVGWA